MGFLKDLFSKQSISSRNYFSLSAMNHALAKCKNEQIRDAINLAIDIGTDLVEMTTHYCTCGECSKYQGRVYSITGTDTRFPTLPEQVFLYGGIHPGCRHGFFPYFYGQTLSGLGLETFDPITYSNRPFVDERSSAEIAEYDQRQLKIAYKKQSAQEYKQLCESFPDIAPKSLSAYSRMKRANSSTYQKIKARATKVSFKEFPN